MLIVACNYLVRDIQSRKNITILTVTMRTLVQIHEIHIDFIVRQLLICLCVKMKQRLLQRLQALDPHLSR